MQQRNDGQGEVNRLQNRFTAYLLKAIQRKKKEYTAKQSRLFAHESSADVQDMAVPDPHVQDPVEHLPVLMRLEDTALLEAIENLDELERRILFARILEECSYHELARMLGLRYKGASAAYYRIIRKLRRNLKGGGM